MLVKNEIATIWNRAVVTQFNVLSQNFPCETKETQTNLNQNARWFARDSNPTLSRIQVGSLTA